MTDLPELKRIPHMLYTCTMKDCNRQAVYFSEDGKWKLCTRHMGLIAQGHAAVIAEQAKRNPEPFNLDALEEYNEDGTLKAAGDYKTRNPSTTKKTF